MENLKKDEEEIEKMYKEELFPAFQKIIEKINIVKQKMEEIINVINLKMEIPNVAITVNNKLIELQNQFYESGVSIYTERDVDQDGQEFVGTSLVGEVIRKDLIRKLNEGSQILSECNKKISEMLEKKLRNLPENVESNPFKRFFMKIKRTLNIKKEDSSRVFSIEDEECIKSYLERYQQLNNEVYNYNLRDNLAESLITYLKENKIELLDERVKNQLEKLGLRDQLLHIQEETCGKKDKTESFRSSKKITIIDENSDNISYSNQLPDTGREEI